MREFETKLRVDVANVFRTAWHETKGQVVPETSDLGLSNVGRRLSATILYADIDGSTHLVDNYNAQFAAEVYKTFLLCSTRIIRLNGGEVRSFDGDRVMGVFIGEAKNTNAAKTGLQINYAVKKIIGPALKKHYNSTNYVLRHTVGIDTSDMLVVRSGIRSNNDLIWVGSAANYAAKMNSLSSDYPTRISADVFNALNENSKFGGNPKRLMWTNADWNGSTIYRSTWHWAP
ncbi:MAG: adenylate/guanylate cyclase domain-containing protein [Pseudomonadota bacterium]